ncbi:Tyr-5 [Aphelenchoides fujianensis]|nr:Tyr-5 [Aphelenchoides fujianensis]
MCERPSESEEYLATVLWPQKIREHVTCMDWGCACPIYDGKVKDGKCELPDGQILSKGLRKEYRQLAREERKAYVDMMNALQQDGTYHQIGRIHRAAGVHSGPSFFPWHREFLKRTEFIFRLYNPHIAIPYWDSTLESYLPAPKDSVMFSRHLMGEPNEDGDVYDSPFHNFTTLDNRPTFNRQLGNQDDGEVVNNARIEWVLKQKNVSRVLAYSMPLMGCTDYKMDDRFLEYSHDYLHYYVDGDMQDRTTSSNDPIFFLHHSFIDSIWELWRQRHQANYRAARTRLSRRRHRIEPPWHFREAKLPLLRPYRNVDGLSNKYTDNLAEYASRPTCRSSSAECASEFLFCDTTTMPDDPHCVSKVRLNGNCTGFEWSDEICYEGRCVDGECQKGKKPVEVLEKKPAVETKLPIASELPMKTTEKKTKKRPLVFEVLDVKEVTPKNSRFM